MSKTVPRIFVTVPLSAEAAVQIGDKQAHYLQDVMRLKAGDAVALFNGRDGEWKAMIADNTKHAVTLSCVARTRPQHASPDMMVCFAPPRGGRIDSIIEKATELGARVLQPVRTERSVVDTVNVAKWERAVREAAEQCERLDVPEIRPMVALTELLEEWDATRPLFYGDETGNSGALKDLPSAVGGARSLRELAYHSPSPLGGGMGRGHDGHEPCILQPPTQPPPYWGRSASKWAILTGPEGGFAPNELAHMHGTHGAYGVSLGPRILRTDTAVITLCALTQAQFGDWNLRPRFESA